MLNPPQKPRKTGRTMIEIPFKELAAKTEKYNQDGITWHFHMFTPSCVFSRSDDQFEILLENPASGEEFYTRFNEKPIEQMRQMAQLAYGPDFLEQGEDMEKSPAGHGNKSYDNADFQLIMEKAREFNASKTPWHNHHLTPDCKFNPEKGRHCIVLEDESRKKIFYAFYDDDPVDDLADLEFLMFGQ
jgi:hypothetical protein